MALQPKLGLFPERSAGLDSCDPAHSRLAGENLITARRATFVPITRALRMMGDVKPTKPVENNVMKYSMCAIIAIASALMVGCNKEKTAIDDAARATKDALDTRKTEVDAEAKYATEQTDVNAKIDKARIEADKVSTQAQLDAEKKKTEAEADAAKAKVDAESR